METDFAAELRSKRGGQMADRLDDAGDFLVVDPNPLLQLRQLFDQLLLSQNHPPESGQNPDDDDAHLHRPLAVQDRGGHENPVFREGEGSLAIAAATLV